MLFDKFNEESVISANRYLFFFYVIQSFFLWNSGICYLLCYQNCQANAKIVEVKYFCSCYYENISYSFIFGEFLNDQQVSINIKI